jgi:diguanylate cyclase (GGDEF)-like protein
LLALRSRVAKISVCAHWLVVPPLLVSGLAVLGFTYGVHALYAIRLYTSMAADTAVTFLLLSLSVLAADSAHGFASIAISDTAGGLVSRRLLPTLPIAIFALGCITLEGQNLGLYDIRFVLAFMVLLGTSVCIVAVAWTAYTLPHVDLTRKQGETEILSLNAGLEQRVQERTRELAQVSSQLRIVNASLELLSRQDGLTGLANRRHFDSYLGEQLKIARRYKRALALVLCDVDSFKAYNDHYGHQAGDECLKLVAAALGACCHRGADLAARYGGEEFAIILPETDLSEAVHVAEGAIKAVARLRIVHEKSPTAAGVTISGGVAVVVGQEGSAQQLIKDADQALFQAKCLGRNRVVAADPGSEPAAVERHARRAHLV